MRKTSPELALSRLLQAFETELIEAGDDEIAAALGDLGMRMSMKGSAALADLRHAAIMRNLAWLYRGRTAEPDGEDDEGSSARDAPVKNPPAASDHKA